MNKNDNFEASAKIQDNLWNALKYWLYDSLLEGSSKVTSPITSHTLKTAISGFQNVQSQIDFKLPAHSKIPLLQYAEILASLYTLWEKYLPEADNSAMDLPAGQRYEKWIARGGSSSHYWPAHKLEKLVRKSGSTYFKRAIIHGSIATLDDIQGFSDMDLAFVIKRDILKNPQKLLQLRKMAQKILALTYSFDPYMHHGPYYIPEIDLNWYAEAMFPPILFRYGVDLIGDYQCVGYKSRQSNNYTDQMILMFDTFFRQLSRKTFSIKTNYDFEHVLGSVMLLPALYLQQKTGVYRYKRDTFEPAQKDFSPTEWEPVRIASELRAISKARYKPQKLFSLFAYHLRRPELLIRDSGKTWSHNLSIEEVNGIVGKNYPSLALQLLNRMREKLQSS